jgi:hypothetical protein
MALDQIRKIFQSQGKLPYLNGSSAFLRCEHLGCTAKSAKGIGYIAQYIDGRHGSTRRYDAPDPDQATSAEGHIVALGIDKTPTQGTCSAGTAIYRGTSAKGQKHFTRPPLHGRRHKLAGTIGSPEQLFSSRSQARLMLCDNKSATMATARCVANSDI